MSVFFAFYVSGGTFWGKNCLNKLFLSHFFWAGNFSDFWGSFFGKAARWAIYVTGDVFSWNGFLRELFVFIIIFKNWADVSQFLSIFSAAMTNLHSTCAGEGSEENLFFFTKKPSLFSDFDPQKLNSEKQLGMFVKTVTT